MGHQPRCGSGRRPRRARPGRRIEPESRQSGQEDGADQARGTPGIVNSEHDGSPVTPMARDLGATVPRGRCGRWPPGMPGMPEPAAVHSGPAGITCAVRSGIRRKVHTQSNHGSRREDYLLICSVYRHGRPDSARAVLPRPAWHPRLRHPGRQPPANALSSENRRQAHHQRSLNFLASRCSPGRRPRRARPGRRIEPESGNPDRRTERTRPATHPGWPT
jgi:hypothetical protein